VNILSLSERSMLLSEPLSLFNQTISVGSQYYPMIGNIQGHFRDIDAHNLTTYGVNGIREIQSSVGWPFSRIQHLYGEVISQYDVPYDPTSLQSSTVDPTGGSLLSPIISNPSSLLQTHHIIVAAALVLLALAVGRSVFLKR
jgi:hypothetical protein